ncbi:MAG: NUDIX hydrolase [Candidatus Pacebacteria bacterium]|nr:NUDIX hydrolase [Candidatus Paceibacterota bacterium]
MIEKSKPIITPLVAVDTVILTVHNNKLCVLLAKIKFGPFKGMHGIPGGRVKIDETLENAAKRELLEKTGLTDVYLEQLYSFGSIKRDPSVRIVSVSYFALVNSNEVELKSTGKYAEITWCPVHKLETLAYDHNTIIKYALFRLKNKIRYTNIMYSLLPNKFTLSDLQKMYELTLEKKLDKRNFRKKIMSSHLIKESGIEEGVSHRPSKLYSFKSNHPVYVEIF